MKHATTCKVCKMPLTVEIDDAYAYLGGDPYKLIPLATCNRCFDYVIGKRSIRRSIIKLASELVLARNSMVKPATLKKLEAESKDTFDMLSQRYAKVVSNYWHRPYLWMEDFTEQLMATPDRIDAVLSGYEKLYREQHVNQTV